MGYRGVALHFNCTSYVYETSAELTFTKEMAIKQSIQILNLLGYFNEIIIEVNDVSLDPETALEIVTAEGFDRKFGVVGYVYTGGGGGGSRSRKPKSLNIHDVNYKAA